jgi:hypothetical protein
VHVFMCACLQVCMSSSVHVCVCTYSAAALFTVRLHAYSLTVSQTHLSIHLCLYSHSVTPHTLVHGPSFFSSCRCVVWSFVSCVAVCMYACALMCMCFVYMCVCVSLVAWQSRDKLCVCVYVSALCFCVCVHMSMCA